MPENGAIPIVRYEPWMEDQVVDLFVRQYREQQETKLDQFRRFFEHPYQANDAVRLVALDGKTVAGFQGWFLWPYEINGRRVRSFQTGSSIVHQEYRRRGILTRMLKGIEEHRADARIECMTVFPVKTAIGGYLRAGWAHPLDLRWYVHPLNPISTFNRTPTIDLDDDAPYLPEDLPPSTIQLTNDPAFREWRTQCNNNVHFVHTVERNGYTTRFELRAGRRGPIAEIIIGDIQSTGCPGQVGHALVALVKELRKRRAGGMLTIAVNRAYESRRLLPVLRHRGFVPLPAKLVRYCVSSCEAGEAFSRPEHWRLYRGDIDVW